MRLVEIIALGNGAHRNQTIDWEITPPDGWAVIPENMNTPNFPFGEITAKEINGVVTVTKWVAGTIPEPELIPEPITQEERIEALENALLELALGGAE